MNKWYLPQTFFLIDLRHMCRKSPNKIPSIYLNVLLWILFQEMINL